MTMLKVTLESHDSNRTILNRQSSYPAEVRKLFFSPFFSAKGVVKIGVKFW